MIEFDTLKRSNAHYNLQNAFNTAENKLGLTKLLDPEGESGRSELRLDECWIVCGLCPCPLASCHQHSAPVLYQASWMGCGRRITGMNYNLSENRAYVAMGQGLMMPSDITEEVHTW